MWCEGKRVALPSREIARMIDSFVIDQVSRRERRDRDDRDRPAVELPVPAPDDRERPVRRSDEDNRDEKPKRGVVVIDLRKKLQ